MRASNRLFAAAVVGLCLWPARADAVRFTLGVAGDVVPVVVDGSSVGSAVRLGMTPILDVEANPYFSMGTYTPFTIYRSGGAVSGASSGAESVFAFSASARYPIFRDTAPREVLLYGTLRGGFGTAEAIAGPFAGLAAGVAATWVESGRGGFLELGVGRLAIPNPGDVEGLFVDRWLVGISLGLIFRLGGESWSIDYR